MAATSFLSDAPLLFLPPPFSPAPCFFPRPTDLRSLFSTPPSPFPGSGEALTEAGHEWVGLDVSPSMLGVALDREVRGLGLWLSEL